MFSALLAVFGSSGFGALLGAASGLFRQRLDISVKKLELEHEAKRWAHDLAVKEKELAYAKLEAESAREVAIIEGEAEIEKSRFGAIGAAYENDKATYNDKLTDRVRGLTRPVLTAAFTLSALAVNFAALYLILAYWPSLDHAVRSAWVFATVNWALLQGSAAVSYWFVSRPGTPPRLG